LAGGGAASPTDGGSRPAHQRGPGAAPWATPGRIEIIKDLPEEYREAAQLLIDACGEPPRGDRIPAQPVR
jgi:hypothetical protein